MTGTFNTLKARFNALLRDEEGATMVEYALLVALVAVVTIGAVTTLGGNTSDTIEAAADAIGSGG